MHIRGSHLVATWSTRRVSDLTSSIGNMAAGPRTPTAVAARNLIFRRSSSPYIVSTKSDLLDRKAIASAFGSGEFVWIKSMDDDQLEEVLTNSWCWGIYKEVEGEEPQVLA